MSLLVRLVFIVLVVTSTSGYSEDAGANATPSELVRLARENQALRAELSKETEARIELANLVANQEARFNDLISGKLKAEKVHVQSVLFDTGTIEPSADGLVLKSNSGGQVIVRPDPFLISKSGHNLTVQSDGNLVLYSNQGGTRHHIWNTGTWGK